MPPAVIENASYDPANPSRIGRRMFSIHPLIYNSNTAIIDGGSAGVSLKANSIPFWTLASRFEVTIRKEHPKKKSHWANLESSVVSTAVRAFANIQSEHKSPEQDVSPTIPTTRGRWSWKAIRNFQTIGTSLEPNHHLPSIVVTSVIDGNALWLVWENFSLRFGRCFNKSRTVLTNSLTMLI